MKETITEECLKRQDVATALRWLFKAVALTMFVPLVFQVRPVASAGRVTLAKLPL